MHSLHSSLPKQKNPFQSDFVIKAYFTALSFGTSIEKKTKGLQKPALTSPSTLLDRNQVFQPQVSHPTMSSSPRPFASAFARTHVSFSPSLLFFISSQRAAPAHLLEVSPLDCRVLDLSEVNVTVEVRRFTLRRDKADRLVWFFSSLSFPLVAVTCRAAGASLLYRSLRSRECLRPTD